MSTTVTGPCPEFILGERESSKIVRNEMHRMNMIQNICQYIMIGGAVTPGGQQVMKRDCLHNNVTSCLMNSFQIMSNEQNVLFGTYTYGL